MNKSATIPVAALPTNASAAKADAMLNRRELAKHLRVSARTIDQWRQERLIPFIKLRKVVLFYWPDVVAHLRENYCVSPQRHDATEKVAA